MAPCPRKDIIDPNVVGIYHCVSRCVRRAFLCGLELLTGRCFDHRKDWLEQGTARLAALFAIDVLDFCVMSNHIHHVLRNRPDIVEKWSDEEVVRRWWHVCPKRKEPDGSPSEMNEAELRMWLSDKKLVEEFRRRLSSISWFMKLLKEPVAKRANREDQVSGFFWDGRFRSTRLLDSAAVLACSIYVDLNAIRAGLAETPEDSRYTSAWHRIQALLQENETPWTDDEADVPPEAVSRTSAPLVDPSRETLASSNQFGGAIAERPDAWLAPVPEEGEQGNQTSPNRRASDKGFLPMTVRQYLELLDWTGRQVRDGKGQIPEHLAPIMGRLGIVTEQWAATIESLDGWFPRALGRAAAVTQAAAEAGRRWFRGVGRCRTAFAG